MGGVRLCSCGSLVCRADHPELAREHFVDDANPLPQVVIVPPDQVVMSLLHLFIVVKHYDAILLDCLFIAYVT